MKKNVTVNMFGTLYPIDEDAYELLKSYIDNLRNYFTRQEGGDEIVDDIETRIAELMNEHLESGAQAVSIEDVRSIIERIGNPEQMDCDYGESDDEEGHRPPQKPKEKPKKRLFRDVDNKMLGGVLSGLGYYFGIDPVWLRIVAVLLTCLSYGTGILIYLICWIIIPPAETPAEKLEMKGDPVNPINIANEIINDTRNAFINFRNGRNSCSYTTSQRSRSVADNIQQVFSAILKAVICITGFGVLAAVVVLLTMVLVGIFWYIFSPAGALEHAFGSQGTAMEYLINICPAPMIWTGSIAAITALSISMYAGLHLLLRAMGKSQPLPGAVKIALLLGWILSIALFVGTCFCVASTADTHADEISKLSLVDANRHDAERREFNLAVLEKAGWRIAKAEGIDRYMANGRHYSGNESIRYLDAYNPNGNMVCEIVRDVKTAPGEYVLEAAARTDGNGCLILAVNGAGQRFSTQVPACGDEGGSIWMKAKNEIDALSSDSTKNDADFKNRRIAEANDGRGFGWEAVKVEGITVGKDSVLSYGVTNIDQRAPWDGTWFSATSFRLTKVK